MNMTQIAFQYRKFIFLVLGIFLLYGVMSYFSLPAREDPQITIREALVITQYPGMNPERVENLITKKLERTIRNIPEVEEIRSTSATGLSIIHVEIQDRYFNLDAIWQDLRNKVMAAQVQLPTGTLPSQVNDEFGDVSVITLALTADDFQMNRMHEMAKHVRDVLYTERGAKKVEIYGVQEERIFLEISNARLAQLGISPDYLISILQNQNIIQPGGTVDTGALSFIVEPTGNFDTLEDIGNTLIAIPNSDDVLPLRDILSITRDYIDPPHQPSYFNGKPAIIFGISMLEGFNVLEFSPRMKTKIDEIQETLPVGMHLDIATYQAEQVEKTVYGVSSSVLQTLVIVLVVVMLFLGIRTGLIVGTIVPFVMLTTLSLMNIFNMELERMSLATLIISLGLLVDNGIVIAEDFKRRLEEGEPRHTALKHCGGDMAIPLLISTLTTILVFLPLMLAQHVAGEYTRSISYVIIISLMTSWVLALCVTPTLCYYFLRVKQPNSNQSDFQTPLEAQNGNSNHDFMQRFYGPYTRFLTWALHTRKLFLAAMFGLLIFSISLMGFVPAQFFPDSDRTQILVYVELPNGTTARRTDQRMRALFEYLNDDSVFPYIDNFSGHVGYGGPRFVLSLSPDDPADNKGFIVLNIDKLKNVDKTIKSLRENIYTEFPDTFIRVSKMFLGPSDSSKLEVQIKGHDADVLFENAERIKDVFREIPGTIDIRTNWENRIVKVLVKVDQQRARRAGVTSLDIANTMQAGFNGLEITEFRDQDNVIPIIMRASQNERYNLDRVRTLNVFSSSRQENIPLFQVADFFPYNEYAKIDRENMFRTITVEAKSTLMTAEDMFALVDPKIQEIDNTLPLNHAIEYDGVIAESADAQQALSASIPMVIGIIILLLVLQFNSYRKPVIIILTIPLMMIGASIGLLVTGSFFGFMVMLGLYSLAGIIINNAIVLIDRIDIEERAGKAPYDAIVSASVQRFRPIIMTSVTTILGLLPLILSRDPLFYGMANAMAFGLGVGTLLTLGVVPVLYAMFYRVKRT